MDWRLKSLAPIPNLGERFGPVANVVENSPEVNPVGFWSPLRIWALVWRTLPQYPNIQIRSYLQRSGDSCTPAANGDLENHAEHNTVQQISLAAYENMESKWGWIDLSPAALQRLRRI